MATVLKKSYLMWKPSFNTQYCLLVITENEKNEWRWRKWCFCKICIKGFWNLLHNPLISIPANNYIWCKVIFPIDNTELKSVIHAVLFLMLYLNSSRFNTRPSNFNIYICHMLSDNTDCNIASNADDNTLYNIIN